MRFPEALRPEPHEPLLGTLRPVARRAGRHQVARHCGPAATFRLDVIQRARWGSAVRAATIPGAQDALAESQLRKAFRAEEGPIDVMVQHAPSGR